MKSLKYAHSLRDRPTHEWQRLEDHLHAVAVAASLFAAKFNSADWAWNAAWLHDLGKAADEFQAYLLRSNGLDDSEYDELGLGRVNHSSAGACLATESLGNIIGLTLAYLAAGHHAGLPDYYSADSDRAALTHRLEEGKANLTRFQGSVDELIKQLRPVAKPPSFVKSDSYHFWVRMLFSCLVDADYLDTESFMNPDQSETRGGFSSIEALKSVFDTYMQKMMNASPDTPVNAVRREVLAACRKAAIQAPGLFSLTVPTGGGKTLSGVAFALDHSVMHGKKRIIYVIPYTSIIEQTANILRHIFGPENVVEHHSNLDPEKETQRSRLAAENWDAPIIVTTNVQFFESLYSARPGRCRKLHNIVNSVIILDEAQLLPPNLLDPCVDALNRLVAHYAVTLVLATATQPALTGLTEPPQEIMPDPPALYYQLKRTEFIFPADLHNTSDWEKISEALRQHDQILCVVNTRRDCYDLFKRMPEGTLHLSALMCGEHRSDKVGEIKQRLKKSMPIRVISTQLVEAGLDIDFPVVYRALAGLDSIAQAGGRCNREGKLNQRGELGKVKVFIPPKAAPRGLLRKGEDTTRQIFGMPDFDAHHPMAYHRYLQLFYASVNDTGIGFKTLLQTDAPHIQFRTAGKKFKLIDDQVQQSVFVRYGDSEKWLDALGRIGPRRHQLRKLQRYCVNLSKRDFDRAGYDGLVEEIWPGYWLWIGHYDPDYGLDLFGQGRKPEDLLI